MKKEVRRTRQSCSMQAASHKLMTKAMIRLFRLGNRWMMAMTL